MAENDRSKLPFFLSEKEFISWTAHWHSHRRVLIVGELTKDSLTRTHQELIKLDYESSDPITLMIESGGGQTIPSLQVSDRLLMLNSPVDCIAIGDCASAAVDLMQMCRKRMMTPSARLLVHFVRNERFWVCDDMEMLKADVRYFLEQQAEIFERRRELYSRRTGQSSEKITELFRQGEVHRVYLSAKQAINFGLADEISTDFKLFVKKKE